MKKVEAIIWEEKLEAVKKALEENSYFGMTVSEVSGRGRQKRIPLQWRAGEYSVDFIDKLKLEIVAATEEDVDSIVEVICEKAKTGEVGDGKIFIYPLKEVIRVRTKEKGADAI